MGLIDSYIWKAWSPQLVDLWEGLGAVALLEELYPFGWALRFPEATAFPLNSLSASALCLLSQPLLQHLPATMLPSMMVMSSNPLEL